MRVDKWPWTARLFKTRPLAAEAVAERERQREIRRLGAPVNLGTRPTKRDRRRYDAGRR